jgi:DNA-binding MarR family transcriptional regulator
MDYYSEDSFVPFQNIGFSIGKARNLLQAEMDVALAGTRITSSHVGALLLLARGVAHSPVGLAKRLAVDAGFVTRVIDRLEKEGLVHRERSSQDRRVVNLTLTEAGRVAAAQVAEITPAVLNRRLSGFSPQEFETLCRLLNKLLAE